MIRVAVTSEYHFLHGEDGIYTDGVYPYAFWTRMLDVFDEVVIVARARRGPLPSHAQRVDGPSVRVIAVPDFVGSRGLATGALELGRACWRASREADAFILRAPGVISSALREVLRLQRRPFGIAVVGDPSESLRTGDLAMRAMRSLAARYLREQVRAACASRFVTTRYLQERYPPRPGTVSVASSDLQLPDELFDLPPRETRESATLRIGFIGMMERPYKGLDVLLDALARTASHSLAIAGDGVLRADHEAHAAKLGLAERVSFLGRLQPGPPIYDFLRTVDLFVLPSLTEGLPRVLLEAMALGLPALATPVGGVPELLDATELVPAGDAAALALAIDRIAADVPRRRRLGRANQDRARSFGARESRRRLQMFHAAVRDAVTG